MKIKISIFQIVISFLFLISSLTVSAGQQDPVVKMSSTGKCHATTSRYYENLQNFRPFDTLELCYGSGGDPVLNDSLALAIHEKWLNQSTGESKALCMTGDAAACDELEEKGAEKVEVANNIKEQDDFYKANFGFGIALTRLGNGNIETITLEDNVINVSSSKKNTGTLMLEAHKFIFQSLPKNFASGDSVTFGHGPFVSVSIADDNGTGPLDAYGAGWMFGWKGNATTSFNLGLGWYVNTKTKQLRDGFKNGDTVTTITDPQKLLKEDDQEGLMLMFSFTW